MALTANGCATCSRRARSTSRRAAGACISSRRRSSATPERSLVPGADSPRPGPRAGQRLHAPARVTHRNPSRPTDSATPSQTSVTVEGNHTHPDPRRELPRPRRRGHVPAHVREEARAARGARHAPFVRDRRDAVRAGTARRPVPRHRARPGAGARPQAGQGRLGRRGGRRDVPRRHRHLHRRAGDRRVRRRRADRRHRLRALGAAGDARGLARARRARPAHDDGPQGVARGATGTAWRASSRRAARGAPSTCATCSSATSSRSAGTTSTPTPRARRCSTGCRSRARRRRSSCATGRCCATRRPRRSPASSACARRSTASASTWSCSAAGPPGSRPPSTAAPRGCGRS